MKGMRGVAPEMRPLMGKTVNQFKAEVEAKYQEKREEIEKIELANANKSEQVDITLPGRPARRRSAASDHYCQK